MSGPRTTGMFDSFIRPCLTCGTTVHVVDGQEQPHECADLPVSDRLAYAWWQGYDTAKTSQPDAPRQPRKPRSVKVEDSLWEAAKRKADERGEILSEEIRAFLKRYISRKEPA